MKTTALALALVLIGASSLSAAPLKGSFLLSADSTTSVTKMMTFSKGNASLISKTDENFRINADEITVDQTDLTRTGITVITCRGVTAASAGLTIPPSKELTLELDSQANIYRLNPAGIVLKSATTSAEKPFSQTLPKLDLRLSSRPASN